MGRHRTDTSLERGGAQSELTTPLEGGGPMTSMMPGLVQRLSVAVMAVVLAACSTGGSSLAPSASLTPVSARPTASSGSPVSAPPSASPQASSFASQTCSTTVATAGLTSDPLNPLVSVGVAELPGYAQVTFKADKTWGGLQIAPTGGDEARLDRSTTIDGSSASASTSSITSECTRTPSTRGSSSGRTETGPVTWRMAASTS